MKVQTKPVSAEFLQEASHFPGGATVCVFCGRSVGFGKNRAPGVLPKHLDCIPAVVTTELEQLERDYQATRGIDYSDPIAVLEALEQLGR